jgi:hypothetical protein
MKFIINAKTAGIIPFSILPTTIPPKINADAVIILTVIFPMRGILFIRNEYKNTINNETSMNTNDEKFIRFERMIESRHKKKNKAQASFKENKPPGSTRLGLFILSISISKISFITFAAEPTKEKANAAKIILSVKRFKSEQIIPATITEQ